MLPWFPLTAFPAVFEPIPLQKPVLYTYGPGWKNQVPSFDPDCLKWQAFLTFCGVDFDLYNCNEPLTSPSGRCYATTDIALISLFNGWWVLTWDAVFIPRQASVLGLAHQRNPLRWPNHSLAREDCTRVFFFVCQVHFLSWSTHHSINISRPHLNLVHVNFRDPKRNWPKMLKMPKRLPLFLSQKQNYTRLSYGFLPSLFFFFLVWNLFTLITHS